MKRLLIVAALIFGGMFVAVDHASAAGRGNGGTIVDNDNRIVTRTSNGVTMTLRYQRLADSKFDITSVRGCVPEGMEAAPHLTSENWNYQWQSTNPLLGPGCYTWLPNPYDHGAKLNYFLGSPATVFHIAWFDGTTYASQSFPLTLSSSYVDPGGRPAIWDEASMSHVKVAKS